MLMPRLVITAISPVSFVRPSAAFEQVQGEDKPTCYGGVPGCQIPTEGRHHSASGFSLTHNFQHFLLLWLLLVLDWGISPPAGINYLREGSSPTGGIWDLIVWILSRFENSTTAFRFNLILSIQTLLPEASTISSISKYLSLLTRLHLLELQSLLTWCKELRELL